MARRPVNVFAMSFLDCMCCGFGAVILVFMIISARIEQESDRRLEGLAAALAELSATVLGREQDLDHARAALAASAGAEASAQTSLEDFARQIEQARAALARTTDPSETGRASLDALQQRLTDLERMRDAAGPVAEDQGRSLRTVVGQGDRQYLTGMKMGGRRVLIVVDSSASMLARTLVNVIRLRSLPEADRRSAEKWQQAVGTVDWLTAHIRSDAAFQIFRFGTGYAPLIEESKGAWIEVGDGSMLDEAMLRLHGIAPSGGTSLHAAFAAIRSMQPLPDNVFLIVDGLPTRGSGPPSGRTVSGEQRLTHFRLATRTLPAGIPINVILLAMEGDPYASGAFWELARATRGSFMTPSADWP